MPSNLLLAREEQMPNLSKAGWSWLVAAMLATQALPAHAQVFAWVQLGDDNKISARAIVEGGSCPTLKADGVSLVMAVRAGADTHLQNVPPGADFGRVTACEAEVRPDTSALLLGDRALPLPPREVRRIVMFGDTGCRIKLGDRDPGLQDCNDTDAWPYAKVAKHAADAKPDLVIHVGDYAYREDACPAARNCAGPWGYGYDSWKADFFEPSQPLFAAAPWIMVRGNHEDCDRAGEGWLRFLDAHTVPKACDDLTGFFLVKRPGLGFVVMDNAKGPKNGDAAGKARVIERLRAQFRQIVRDVPQQAWLLSHRPFNALRFASATGYISDNDIQEAAIGDDLPASVRMIVSGHVHIFEALDFADARAPQLVVGTGGDNLVDLPPQQSTGVLINGVKVARSLIFARFGYTLWEKAAAAWNAKIFDDDNRLLATCTLVSRALTCKGKDEGE
jgi:Calcineurin-like phosphoesterase